MTNLEKEYFNKWMEQVHKNKTLKLELEKYKKLYEKNGDFQKQHFEYKKYFEPLIQAYNELFYYTSNIQTVFEDLILLYKSNLLLNPLFTDIKIPENKKTEIINETRIYLNKYKNEKIPKQYLIERPPKEGVFSKKKKRLIPIKKEFELKHFVVKKHKNSQDT